MTRWLLHSVAWTTAGAFAFWFGGRIVHNFNPKVDKARWIQ